jgi:hypothetical protein
LPFPVQRPPQRGDHDAEDEEGPEPHEDIPRGDRRVPEPLTNAIGQEPGARPGQRHQGSGPPAPEPRDQRDGREIRERRQIGRRRRVHVPERGDQAEPDGDDRRARAATQPVVQAQAEA